MQKITFTKNDIKLDIKFSPEENTIWMSQNDIALLFNKSQERVRKIISTISQKTLDEVQYRTKMTIVAKDGKAREVYMYNLDIIKQIGYKIDPIFTGEFVAWCNEELNRLNNKIVPIKSKFIRFIDGKLSLEVNVSPMEQTVWLTQNSIAELFDTTQPNISQHITNIINENELVDDSVHKESLYTAIDGKDYMVSWYNLDMILAIGYRIKTKRAISFRRWATSVLKEYMLRGYAIDDNRIKSLESNFVYLKSDVDDIKNKIDGLKELVYKHKDKRIVHFKGEEFDAYDFFCNLVNEANENIIIVDPYVDEVLLSIIKNKKHKVEAIIITTNKCTIGEEDLEKFQSQYGSITIIKKPTFHSRNILIDDNELYLLDASFNRAGNYQTSVFKYEEGDPIEAAKANIYGLMKKR